MFQTFFTQTIISGLIKNLLSKHSLPLLNFVYDEDFLIEGCKYIYKNTVINCTASGFLNPKGTKELQPIEAYYQYYKIEDTPYTRSSSQTFDTYPVYIKKSAKYEVISNYADMSNKDQNNYLFKSCNNYYDPQTHKYLGEYLRYIKWRTGTNLMPFYNCYNHASLQDVVLTPKTVNFTMGSNAVVSSIDTNYVAEQGIANSSKQFVAPIKFGKTYTVAVSSSSNVFVRAFLYGDAGLIRDFSGTAYSDRHEFRDTFVTYQQTSFDKPFLFRIDTLDKELYQLEKHLVLVIQTDRNNSSSCTVLEGDFVTPSVNGETYKVNDVPRLKLLECNTGTSYAFSPRLVEYLLYNVVTPHDELTKNIVRVQHAISNLDSHYKAYFEKTSQVKGYWDEHLDAAINRILEKYKETYYLVDQNGHVNKDLEVLLSRVGGVRIDVDGTTSKR